MKKLEIVEVQAMLLDLMKIVHKFMQDNNLEYYLLGGSALGAVRHNGFIPWDDDIDIGMKREDYERFLSISNQFDKDYEVSNFWNTKNCDYGLTRIYIKNTFIDNPTISKTKLDKRLYFDVFPLDNVPNDDLKLAKFEMRISKKKVLLQMIDAREYKTSTIKNFVKKVISLLLRPFRQLILRSFDRLMKKYRHTNTTRICSLCSQYSFKKQVMNKNIYGTPTLAKFEDEMFYIPEKIDEYLTTLYGKDYMQVPPVEKRRKGHSIYVIEK